MKKFTLSFLALFSLCILHSSAQTFQNIIGTPNKDERGYSITRDVEGNILVAGTFEKADNFNYPFLLWLNADGTIKKAATIDSLGYYLSYPINIVAVHTFTNKPNGYIATVNYKNDVIVIRFKSYGEIIWSKRLNAVNNNEAQRILPIYSPVTNFLAGFYLLTDNFYNTSTLIKLTADGDIVWQKRIEHPENSNNYDAFNLLPITNGGCLVVGTRTDTASQKSSISKFAAGGALQWTLSYSFFNHSREEVSAIAATSDGYILSGDVSGNKLVFKIDTLGNVIWANSYNIFGDYVKSIINDANGNIILPGSFYDTSQLKGYILKLNSSGNIILAKKYNFYPRLNDIALAADGYYAVGSLDSIAGKPKDIYILKTDFSGNVGGNCAPSAISVTKKSYDFINVTEPGLRITIDNFTSSNLYLTTRTLHNFKENWCGSSFAELSKINSQTFNSTLSKEKFKAYLNYTAGEVNVLYNIDNSSVNARYEVVLYNSSGMATDKKLLQPNLPVTISMTNKLPGLYLVVLEKDGRIIERQNVVWTR